MSTLTKLFYADLGLLALSCGILCLGGVVRSPPIFFGGFAGMFLSYGLFFVLLEMRHRQ